MTWNPGPHPQSFFRIWGEIPATVARDASRQWIYYIIISNNTIVPLLSIEYSQNQEQ